MTDHLDSTRSDRGFDRLPTITGPYGSAVTVYESSASIGPHLWLFAETGDREPQGGVGVHLTAEQAWQLREQIEHLLANHYQGDARPEGVSS